MKTLKKQAHQRERSGQTANTTELRILNASSLILMALYNGMNHILSDNNMFSFILYTIPFILTAIFLYLQKGKLALYIVYLFIGSLTIIFAERVIEYSGMIFILMASGIVNNYRLRIISVIVSFIALSIRLTLLSKSVPVTIQMVLLFCFIVYSCYLIFFKRHKRRVDLWAEISEKEKAILKLFMRGYDYAKISKVLKVKDKKESIRTSITRCRNLSGCENDIQFGIWLSEKG